jgi:hypothetical protein
MVAKLRLLFSLFTDLSDDLARPVVFPLVYLVSLVRVLFCPLTPHLYANTECLVQLTVESEAKQLPSVKGATCPGTHAHALIFLTLLEESDIVARCVSFACAP